MRTSTLSVFLGLTTSLATGLHLSVQAATFDYNKLQLITARPISSSSSLSFFGDVINNQGQAVFFNPDPSALDHGHTEISLNSPNNVAPYYATGRNASPEESGATSAGNLTNVQGFSNFFNYLNNNAISLNSISIGYGQKSGQSFTEAWNLGNDILGQDWLASPTSTLEERIYRANPDSVEIFLSYNNQKIINFGYSDFYAILEYGDTPQIDDDFDALLSNVIPAFKVSNLDSLANGLANAFLLDVEAAGGGIQAVSEVVAAPDAEITFNNGFVVANIPLSISLRAVALTTVPEPSAVVGLLAFSSLGLMSYWKKRKS